MLVGLSELSNSINNELVDVSDAFGPVNQWDDEDSGQGRSDRGRRSRNRGNQWDVVAND